MSESFPYADIIILALIAGFILLRLRSVLGQQTGHDNPDFFKKNIPAPLEREPVIRMSDKAQAKAKPKEEPQDPYLATLTDTAIIETLGAIKTKDASFSPSAFLSGAKLAFEMVFDGFAKGDKAPLKMLLSDELYKTFEAEIDARPADPATKTETTLVSVSAKDIIKAELNQNIARLSVKFMSEQVSVVRDKAGKIVEGDASQTVDVLDEWTFERDVASKNPNWKIIDT